MRVVAAASPRPVDDLRRRRGVARDLSRGRSAASHATRRRRYASDVRVRGGGLVSLDALDDPAALAAAFLRAAERLAAGGLGAAVDAPGLARARRRFRRRAGLSEDVAGDGAEDVAGGGGGEGG